MRRLKLWLHFMFWRGLCWVRRYHRWGEPHEVMTAGPLHVPPDEREYQFLRYTRWCQTCLTHEDIPIDDNLIQVLTNKARAFDWEEWNDPDVRAALLSLSP